MQQAETGNTGQKYFSIPLIYVYSLLLAAIDSVIFNPTPLDEFNFETFSMRTLTIFTYWLVAKLSGDFAKKRDKSFIFGSVFGLSIAIIFTLVVSYLIVSF